MRRTAVVWMSLAIAVAVLGYTSAALAVDQHQTAKDSRITITGKIETKAEKVAGKDQNHYSVLVTNARGADGKAMTSLDGKTFRLSGPKASEAAKYAGKEAELRGTMKGDSEFIVDWVMPWHAPAPTPAPHN